MSNLLSYSPHHLQFESTPFRILDVSRTTEKASLSYVSHEERAQGRRGT